MFKYTTAISKLRRLTKRIKVIQGGASAGKTFGILPILIDKAIKTKDLRIDIVSITYGHLKGGAIADFKRIMQTTNRWDDNCWHDTDHIYTFKNRSYIKFLAIDKPGKARGPRRDILYVNECNLIPFETYNNLSERTEEEIWLDYNPTNEFYVHTEVIKDDDAEMIILTFKDNEALPPSLLKEFIKMEMKSLESDYWLNRWRVYGLGLIGRLEGVVFENIQKIKDIPLDAILLGYGMDFGFTNDPTTLIAVYEYQDTIILDEIIYQTGLLNSDIISKLKNNNITREEIIADSAEPKSIEEIKRAGFRINKATKGDGSIMFGIGLMQEKEIYITTRSINTIEEFDKYAWATSSDGKALNKPIDKYNHAIDAVRYFFIKRLGTKKRGIIIDP